MSNKEINFTEGSIIKKLISFMIPILGSLILQAMYGAVDLLIVEGLVQQQVYQEFQQALKY